MSSLETYRKHAKQLQRWHRDRNYSVGEKVRLLARFRHLADNEILAMAMPLALAQEVVAVEAGFASWAALKTGVGEAAPRKRTSPSEPKMLGVIPILFVRDVAASAAFFEAKLGFAVDFLHGKPPFYGAVSRDGVCLHLRHVAAPNFHELAAREPSLIVASIEVANVKALFETYDAAGVDFPQRLARQAWGGLDFHIRDPDGNVISFVQFDVPTEREQ